jgi:hypothetical protein
MNTRRQFASSLFGLSVASQANAQGRPVPNLSPAETSRLLFMREEEKLAHDVYIFADEKWNLRVFRNIAQSETMHFNQIGVLLARYSIVDPSASKLAGEFVDPKLSNLYLDLTAKCALSLKDALEAGVIIEKVDIDDLEAGLAETKQTDIKRVYTNLMNASYSHLDAFEESLELLACITN